MNCIEFLIDQVRETGEAFALVAEDLQEEPLVRLGGVGNHAWWTLGHMAIDHGMWWHFLTGEENPQAAWMPLFTGGTQPNDDGQGYPAYAEMLGVYRQHLATSLQRIAGLTEADLDHSASNVPPGHEEEIGTYAKCLKYMAIHPMHHSGQLSGIRRQLGRKPLFL